MSQLTFVQFEFNNRAYRPQRYSTKVGGIDEGQQYSPAWSRYFFISPHLLSPAPCLLGYLYIRLRWLCVNTLYRLGPSVNALQCLTGKVDNNNTNNIEYDNNSPICNKAIN